MLFYLLLIRNRKEEVYKKTAQEQQKLTTLQRAQGGDVVENVQSKITELKRKKEQVQEANNALNDRRKRMDELTARDNKILQEKRQAHKDLENAKEQKKTRMDTLSSRLEEIEETLKEAKQDQRESRREKEFAEALEGLKRIYPHTVRGRVFDLCKTTQRKYNVAVTITMGHNMDAIIVNDHRTGVSCLEYFKVKEKCVC